MRVLLLLTMAMMAVRTQPSMASDAAWQALRNGGTVALLRHARAPGTGDPSGFRLDDCSSQRNLSPEGRTQAQELGEHFRAQGVQVERVLSSRWCRAVDTGRLAFGSRVEPFPPLDSFFSERSRNDVQTNEVRKLVSSWKGPGVLAMVTHQVNITALTNIFPAEGEVLVLRPTTGGFEVVGRITP